MKLPIGSSVSGILGKPSGRSFSLRIPPRYFGAVFLSFLFGSLIVSAVLNFFIGMVCNWVLLVRLYVTIYFHTLRTCNIEFHFEDVRSVRWVVSKQQYS